MLLPTFYRGADYNRTTFEPSCVIGIIPGIFAKFRIQWCYNGHFGRQFSDGVVYNDKIFLKTLEVSGVTAVINSQVDCIFLDSWSWSWFEY